MKPFLNFRLSPFPAQKYLLLAALVCEALALLIRKGILAADSSLVSRLTVAGAMLVLLYLVYDGLRRKLAQAKAAIGLDGELDEPFQDSRDDGPNPDGKPRLRRKRKAKATTDDFSRQKAGQSNT